MKNLHFYLLVTVFAFGCGKYGRKEFTVSIKKKVGILESSTDINDFNNIATEIEEYFKDEKCEKKDEAKSLYNIIQLDISEYNYLSNDEIKIPPSKDGGVDFFD